LTFGFTKWEKRRAHTQLPVFVFARDPVASEGRPVSSENRSRFERAVAIANGGKYLDVSSRAREELKKGGTG
jgi:hypothetical protein